MFARHAGQLLDAGWPALLPLKPGTKKPAISSWQAFNTRRPTEAQIGAWGELFPEGGIGHAAGYDLLFVDLDFLERAAASMARAVQLDCLGYTPLLRVGRAPKTMGFYRLPPDHGLASCSYQGLQLFATTGQVVLLGIHPETHQPYHWPDAHPTEAGPAEMPLVTPRQVDAFLECLAPLARTHDLTLERASPGTATPYLQALAAADAPEHVTVALLMAQGALRHPTMVGLTIALVMRGHDDKAVEALLLRAYLERCPATEHRARHADFRRTLRWIRKRFGPSATELRQRLNAGRWSRWGV
jgi:hypothetical protein